MTESEQGGHSEDVAEHALGTLLIPSPRPSIGAVSVSVPARDEARDRSFRALYDAHVDFVWRNLRRLGVPASEVEDRTQKCLWWRTAAFVSSRTGAMVPARGSFRSCCG